MEVIAQRSVWWITIKKFSFRTETQRVSFFYTLIEVKAYTAICQKLYNM